MFRENFLLVAAKRKVPHPYSHPNARSVRRGPRSRADESARFAYGDSGWRSFYFVQS